MESFGSAASRFSLIQDLNIGLPVRWSWVQVLGRAEGLPLSFISLGADTAQILQLFFAQLLLSMLFSPALQFCQFDLKSNGLAARPY